MTYRLDPEIQTYVDACQRFTPVDDSIEARRESFLQACRACTSEPPPGWTIADITLDGLRLRCYKPAGQAPQGGWPTLLYLHGGGWNLGDLDTHDWFAHALARRVPVAIVAVAYRLAPEHSYPAPLEDCLAVWQGLRQGRIDPALSRERLIVGGDSAGGTLAAGLCMALRRDGQAQPLGQLLIYPVLTTREDLPSMREHTEAPLMTVVGLRRSLAGYVSTEGDRLDPCAMPLAAQDFSGLAPAFIAVAGVDPLRDHGEAYGQALRRHGVDAEVEVVEGLVHSGLRAFGVGRVERLWDRLGNMALSYCSAS
ncbi:alpha/beta hydrolase [Pseudomonas sp. 148P]|uniref:Alpha/beta hydrolase n=1 Tax=Pseudomonas ulcerans TaxID=3115852 RepID=A0ABU7HX68_9PSED|nr:MULTISPECIES: alpha/beta hydrolase [unclassified Pseudomonas]MEE1924348.1 alpha/beta hydrolase [Pseudomonas sp. 147P]MEE1936101.1 alpha/beta hydrolase [Pseudomonas sp. 148P]